MLLHELPVGARQLLPEYPGYWATPNGEIISTRTPGFRGQFWQMAATRKASGYIEVFLRHISGRSTVRGVHRLICAAFHGMPSDVSMKAMHLNGDKTDNRSVNLCWGTHAENLRGPRRDSGRPRSRRNPASEIPPVSLFPIRYSERLDDLFIDEYGRIWSFAWGKYRQLAGSKTDKGYWKISYSRTGNPIRVLYVHRLVCYHFHGAPPPGKTQVRHLDGNPDNNHPSNLQWGDNSEQYTDRVTHKTCNRGRTGSAKKLTDFQVSEIRTRRKQGETCKALATEFDVNPGYVSALCTGIWRKEVV